MNQGIRPEVLQHSCWVENQENCPASKSKGVSCKQRMCCCFFMQQWRSHGALTIAFGPVVVLDVAFQESTSSSTNSS
jgi:hypothetical protein